MARINAPVPGCCDARVTAAVDPMAPRLLAQIQRLAQEYQDYMKTRPPNPPAWQILAEGAKQRAARDAIRQGATRPAVDGGAAPGRRR
jgi:hypothetical protein